MKRLRSVRKARPGLPVLGALMISTVLIAVCMTGPPGLAHSVAIAVLSAAGLGALLLSASLVWQAMLQWQLTRLLNLRSRAAIVGGFAVRVLPGTGTPFVAGLYRPTIYCPESVLRQLTTVELAAVLAHESWHQRSHAPASLLVIGALERLVGAVPRIRMQLEMARAKLEVDADRYAIASGARRSTLASALLRLPATPAFANAAAFHSAAELRVRALLDDRSLEWSAHAGLRWVLSAGMFTIGCLAYYLR
jgi:hypothetical protein